MQRPQAYNHQGEELPFYCEFTKLWAMTRPGRSDKVVTGRHRTDARLLD